ncbi:lactadherin isoform X2 [Exaiptasia diaphana]|uniref:F5/8 type C domain-containing protein n=1 Tax=Exaiptasia diaphana TaxID=2652724 RepID=A0A913YUS7_EXADI|nr:lactadherin isoform X2 [Exaiptasia diaphana]
MKDNDKTGHIALRMELYESKEDEGVCSYALGMQSRIIKDSQVTASSSYSNYYKPSEARLDNINRRWISATSNLSQWLQIDFLKVKMINGIATQGSRYSNRWVKEYRLEYKNSTVNTLNNYTMNSEPVKFKGNSDRNSIVYNALHNPILAQIVRIVPIQWQGFIVMRVELYGCPYMGSYHDGSK